MKKVICLSLLTFALIIPVTNAQDLKPNIYFYRPDTPEAGSGGIMLEIAAANLASRTLADASTGQVLGGSLVTADDDANNLDGDHSMAYVDVVGRAVVEGVVSNAHASFSARNYSPLGTAVATPNHEIVGIHMGIASVSTGAIRSASSEMYTNGYLDSSYLTEPGDAVQLLPGNNYATTYKVMHFLLAGPPEVLVSDPMFTNAVPPLSALNKTFSSWDFSPFLDLLGNPILISDPDDIFRHFTSRNSFLHEITIGESHLTTAYLGGGVFVIDGFLSRETENEILPNESLFALRFNGLNDLFTSSEVVGLEDDNISVQVYQATRSTSTRFTDMQLIPSAGPPSSEWVVRGGPSGWITAMTTSAWMYGKDLLVNDSQIFDGNDDDGGDAGGNGGGPGGPGGNGIN